MQPPLGIGLGLCLLLLVEAVERFALLRGPLFQSASRGCRRFLQPRRPRVLQRGNHLLQVGARVQQVAPRVVPRRAFQLALAALQLALTLGELPSALMHVSLVRLQLRHQRRALAIAHLERLEQAVHIALHRGHPLLGARNHLGGHL